MGTIWIVSLLLMTLCQQGYCALKLANYFGNHMVLQRGPQRAVLWGTADTEGDAGTAKVIGHGADATPVTAKVAQGRWKVALPAHTVKGPFHIRVSSSDGNVTLYDVLFGDVWLCSGQSNMYFSLQNVINATEELQHALQFPEIRFTRARRVQSDTPQDTMTFDIPWTGPNSRFLGLNSAVCWLFAEYLQPKVNYPIGLVESSWGGTPIEAWMPPEALSDCAHHTKRGPRNDTVLWNSMIHPLLSTTLYGALWYQGEANAAHYSYYGCQVMNMVKQWRMQFHQQSLQQTSDSFPFGYVQLAALTNKTMIGSFPMERWAQTAYYGYSPNPSLPNTFMAVAMDLPDYQSPQGAIHPRFKQDVAERLVLGALNVGYGRTDVSFQGPFPTAMEKDFRGPHTLSIRYDNGTAHLTVNNNYGFEVCCSVHNTTHCGSHDHWATAPITQHLASEVTVSTAHCGARHVVGLRYEWRTSPCDYKQCSLYDSVSGLPAPTYISNDLSADAEAEVIG